MVEAESFRPNKIFDLTTSAAENESLTGAPRGLKNLNKSFFCHLLTNDTPWASSQHLASRFSTPSRVALAQLGSAYSWLIGIEFQVLKAAPVTWSSSWDFWELWCPS